ncbi:RND efflux system [Klebsiella michiganensis]|nr:RND efflux system [Klebsiella michiganensis]
MVEEKLPPKEATEKSMSQIQGALVGIPWCYRQCLSRWPSLALYGAIYRQFSITIVSAMALSVLVALHPDPRAVCHITETRISRSS